MDNKNFNWVERKTYKVVYNIIEKLLHQTYDYLLEVDPNTPIDFTTYAFIINEKLKGK